MLTFPNIFAWGIKPNNQSLHTGEKQAYISNRFCSRASETKSVTIAPGLPYLCSVQNITPPILHSPHAFSRATSPTIVSLCLPLALPLPTHWSVSPAAMKPSLLWHAALEPSFMSRPAVSWSVSASLTHGDRAAGRTCPVPLAARAATMTARRRTGQTRVRFDAIRAIIATKVPGAEPSLLAPPRPPRQRRRPRLIKRPGGNKITDRGWTAGRGGGGGAAAAAAAAAVVGFDSDRLRGVVGGRLEIPNDHGDHCWNAGWMNSWSE